MFDSKPAFVKRYDLEKWYASIPDDQRKRIVRYVDDEVMGDAPRRFLWKVAQRALRARDADLAIALCMEGMDARGDDFDLHMLHSVLIEAYASKRDAVKAKEWCLNELELFPAMAEAIRSNNGGGMPKEIPCRNLLIDIIVGAEGDYDAGFAMIDRFVELGLLTEEERDYRVNSLKVRRLTYTLDSVFTLKKKDS